MDDKIFISGDWEYDSVDDRYDVAFEAVRVVNSFNGFVTPVVSPRVMGAIMARQSWLNFRDADIDYIQMQWDGNGVMIHDPEDPHNPGFILPDDDGNFSLDELGIAWEQISPYFVIRTLIRS